MNSWLVIILRTIILFFFTLAMSRVIGKTSLSNTSLFNYCYIVMGIIIALTSLNIVSNIYFGLVLLGVWSILLVGLNYLCMKSKRMHNIINGKERFLIKNGKVMEDNLSKIRFSGEDLIKELRIKNVFNLADVEFAVMENTGDISISLKADKKPITAHDLGEKVSLNAEPETVILNGNMLNRGLTNAGLNQNWLISQLEIKGVTLDNVFIGQVDSSGDLYLDLFDDNIEVPKSELKEMLYANLERCQADLMSFALETKNEKIKKIYNSDADKLKLVMEKLLPYLLR